MQIQEAVKTLRVDSAPPLPKFCYLQHKAFYTLIFFPSSQQFQSLLNKTQIINTLLEVVVRASRPSISRKNANLTKKGDKMLGTKTNVVKFYMIKRQTVSFSVCICTYIAEFNSTVSSKLIHSVIHTFLLQNIKCLYNENDIFQSLSHPEHCAPSLNAQNT